MPDNLKFKIAISGAADTEFMNSNEMAEVTLLGQLIAGHGMVTVTGATTGAPFWAAKGAKEAGGRTGHCRRQACNLHHGTRGRQ